MATISYITFGPIPQIGLRPGDTVNIEKGDWQTDNFKIKEIRFCNQRDHLCRGCTYGMVLISYTGDIVCLSNTITKLEHTSQIVNKIVVV